MIRLTQKLTTLRTAAATLRLPIDSRIRSRLRATLEDGQEVGLFLPRGLILRGGDQLLSEDESLVVQVEAAAESVSTIYCDDSLLLMRCAYHLGNRHVPLEVTAGYLRYQHDHVLDAMVEGLGAKVTCEQAPFEPEAGAYSGDGHGGHHHGHDHDHGHSHSHNHSH